MQMYNTAVGVDERKCEPAFIIIEVEFASIGQHVFAHFFTACCY